MAIAKKFPLIDPKRKICSACRKRAYTVNSSNINVSGESLEDNNVGIAKLEEKRSRELTSREMELEKMLTDLKERFSSLPHNNPDRLRILTIAPPSWSVRKLAFEFGTTVHMAKKAKNLRSSDGVLSTITSRAGQTLPDETIQKVKEFYLNDSNSNSNNGKSQSNSGKRT